MKGSGAVHKPKCCHPAFGIACSGPSMSFGQVASLLPLRAINCVGVNHRLWSGLLGRWPAAGGWVPPGLVWLVAVMWVAEGLRPGGCCQGSLFWLHVVWVGSAAHGNGGGLYACGCELFWFGKPRGCDGGRQDGNNFQSLIDGSFLNVHGPQPSRWSRRNLSAPSSKHDALRP